jgi:hypothetical protein
MLEVKYLPTAATRKAIESAFAQAYTQLDRYGSDTALVPLLTLGKELKAGALVFVGAREVLFRPWPRPKEEGLPVKPTKETKPAKRRRARAVGSRKRG